MLHFAAILLAATAAAAQADGEKAFKSFAEVAVPGGAEAVWTTTDGDIKVEHTYRKVANDHFLQITAQGGPLPGVSIMGVDPETKKCARWQFNGDGGVWKSFLTLESDGVWLLEGKELGPKGENHYKGKLTRVDANTVKEEVLEFVVNGAKQKLGTFTWTRKP